MYDNFSVCIQCRDIAVQIRCITSHPDQQIQKIFTRSQINTVTLTLENIKITLKNNNMISKKT